jgi:hypothetical protein
MFYAFTGVLIFVQGLFWLLPDSWSSFAPPKEFVLAVFLGSGLASFLTAASLLREGRVHAKAFRKGSQCSRHSEELAYDRCAICGRLFCEKCLVRVKPGWSSMIGFFRFNGVACKVCSHRRVKWSWLFGLSIWLVFLPPLLLFLNLNPVWFYPSLDLAQATSTARGATLAVVAVATMMTLGWWVGSKTWAMPSLSMHPEEIVNLETRIVVTSSP